MSGAGALAVFHSKVGSSPNVSHSAWAALRAQNETHMGAMCYRINTTTGVGVLVQGQSWAYSVPLLLKQISLAVVITRCIVSLLKPLRMPRIVAEIIAGIIIGPSVLGVHGSFFSKWFPPSGKIVLETLGYVALAYYYFMIGVKQDPMDITVPGKKGVLIAIPGFLIPFFFSTTIGRRTINVSIRDNSFFAFLGLFCSTSSFPVLATVVFELKLLNSELGKLAISASMVNDIMAWCTKIVEMALWQRFAHQIVKVLASFVAFLAVLVCVVRPAVLSIIRRKAPEERIKDIYIIMILAAAPFFGLLSDIIGLGSTFGPFVLGLLIPSGPPLGSVLIEKLEVLVSGILMPIFYTNSGLRTKLSALGDSPRWNFALPIIIGYIGKLVGTVLPSIFFDVSLRDSVLLGLLMNTKGIVELVNINDFRAHEMLDDQTFLIMLLFLTIVSGIISYVISSYYDPATNRQNVFHRRRTLQNSEAGFGLGILACVHTQFNVPTLVNLVELSRASEKGPVSLYPLQIRDLRGRAAPLLISHKARAELEPQSDTAFIVHAFQNYAKDSGVKLHAYTAIAPFSTIHQEMCRLAEKHRVSFMILPFHKAQKIMGMEVTNPSYRTINQNVLEDAPCSVGILIDRGLVGIGGESGRHVPRHIGVLFIGRADDREALAYVGWMADNPDILITVFRVISEGSNGEDESLLDKVKDEELLSEFQHRHMNNMRVVYEEKAVANVDEMVALVKYMGNVYNLVVVGRQSGKDSPIVAGLENWSECPELGIIGDLLASSEIEAGASVLVVQQYTGSMAYVYNIPKNLP